MATSKGVVLAAMFANGAIAVLKFLGFLLTGSPAMLSETYHSISDTGNQVFLLVGLWYGERDPTRSHPFGYGKAQFFYSFLVSVLLFGIAGWESLKHGYDAVFHGGDRLLAGSVSVLSVSFPAVWVNYGVLLGGIVFEGYAFRRAYRATKQDIRRHDWSGFVEAFHKTSNTTVLTALTEDTVALVGMGLALIGITLTEVTGNHVYDAFAAVLIGLLLMGFSVALAWENKRLLIGESLPDDEERSLRTIVEEWAAVDRIVDFRTVYFGPDEIVVTADIAFRNDLDTEEIDDHITAIERALRRENRAVSKIYIEPED
ncbi:MAG: cation diffusion facilitator family transporter [Halodesulfurarchaeum sp.]